MELNKLAAGEEGKGGGGVGCGGAAVVQGKPAAAPMPRHMLCTAAKLPASAKSSNPTAVWRFHLVLCIVKICQSDVTSVTRKKVFYEIFYICPYSSTLITYL